MQFLAVLRGPGVELPRHFVDDDLCTGVVQFPGDFSGTVGMALPTPFNGLHKLVPDRHDPGDFGFDRRVINHKAKCP